MVTGVISSIVGTVILEGITNPENATSKTELNPFSGTRDAEPADKAIVQKTLSQKKF